MPSLRQVVKLIQDDFEENTGSRPNREAAEVLFDQMAAAFQEKAAGAGWEYAVRQEPLLADYFRNYWVGEQHRSSGDPLRAAWKEFVATEAGQKYLAWRPWVKS